MLFSEFNSVSNSISNFVRIGENEFDRCSVNFTNRFPIFSATEEYGLDCHAVSRLAALRRVYGLQRLCPRVLSNQRHSHLFYLLVLFSTPLFYRRFRAWTDAEFVLYSLLMIVLTGLWFILSEVFDSGSELFCSI